MRLTRVFVVLLFAFMGNAIAGQPLPDGHEKPIGPVEFVANIECNPWFGVEGIAVSPRNGVFIGSGYEGEIHKIAPDGEVSLFADLVPNPDDGYLLGLAADARSNIYAAVVGCNAANLNGVWRVNARGESAFVMPIPSAGCWASAPNALTFDEDGNLYATESKGGGVWRLGAHGRVQLWAQDDLLKPVSAWGANGITYRKHALWVLNTDSGAIIQIPILKDGRAGRARVFVQSDLLVGADGAQFDVRGNLYVGNVYSGDLLRVSPTGEIETIITAEQFNGFYWPTNPVFGFGPERTTIYISGGNPSVVRVDVGVPGMLMPQFTLVRRSR